MSRRVPFGGLPWAIWAGVALTVGAIALVVVLWVSWTFGVWQGKRVALGIAAVVTYAGAIGVLAFEGISRRRRQDEAHRQR